MYTRYVLMTVAMALLTAAPSFGLDAVGADAYTGKDPIGGGPGYTRYVDQTKAAYTVSTLAELKSALGKAKPGEIIYVADDAEIDATGERLLVVPGGVTLAGNRGRNGSPGPLIKATELNLPPTPEESASLAANPRYSLRWELFKTGGPGVRVTGLRIQGPDTQIRESAYVAPNCDCIAASHSGIEVDNCEIWGWSHAGISLSNTGDARIHHCYIHHCRRMGLGYGICLAGSKAYIEANRFAENRHDIAGTGRIGTSYWALYNISEANEPPISHAFDMHGNHESRRPDEVVPHYAGDYILIAFNTFKSCQPRDCITIRGEPRMGVTIHHNLYEKARFGARFMEPCANALIYEDFFSAPPSIAYYSFGADGNNLNWKRMKAGIITSLP